MGVETEPALRCGGVLRLMKLLWGVEVGRCRGVAGGVQGCYNGPERIVEGGCIVRLILIGWLWCSGAASMERARRGSMMDEDCLEKTILISTALRGRLNELSLWRLCQALVHCRSCCTNRLLWEERCMGAFTSKRARIGHYGDVAVTLFSSNTRGVITAFS